MIEEVIDRLKPKSYGTGILRYVSEEDLAHAYHGFLWRRLRSERLATSLMGRSRKVRVAATACWRFPIYSQTFVYQELTQLINAGFDLRFLYSSLNPRDHLPAQFSNLWSAKRKMVPHPSVYERDQAYFRQRMPEKVNQLVEMVCRASGFGETELSSHYHFRQAFSFTRMVEAYQPDYLHSYFFYEGTFFTFFASYLLGIPRGVSCYADHVLQDYELKMVPLHMDQCSVVIATSERIKRELMAIAPKADPSRIVVKPNAINSLRFPDRSREEPAKGEPFRLTCVSRIEPKKGIIYLVEAMRELMDRGLDVHVHLLGGVDNTPAIQEYARAVDRRIQDLNVGSRVHLEGRKSESEIKKFLDRSQLFVAPFIETDTGDKDGIPTALLEAMSSGLPAVATDAGSITEVIDPDVDGILVAQRDKTALADAIQALLLDPARRQQLGREAAQKVRRHFNISVCERLFHERIRNALGPQSS